MRRTLYLFVIVPLFLLTTRPAMGDVIEIEPGDDYAKIEAAEAGDEVVIAPGTYKFRVRLTQLGSTQLPIVIRAKDPTNRPVWNLEGQPVGQWPGSYTAGDKHRGCWQVTGSHYIISGIEFRNCQDSSSAGLRAVNCGPLTVRDCVFAGNTNGLTGSSEDLIIEFSEFFDNGKEQAGSPSHNIYVYGGKFTLRYSYLHDPTEGQNFHIRAGSSVIEYNWMTRPGSYPGDLMTCENQCGGTGSDPITQKMLLRGNVITQDEAANRSQIVALFNDGGGGSSDGTGAVAEMELTMVHNTIIGTAVGPGKTQRLVNMRNDGIDTTVHLHNNVIYQVKELAVPSEPGTASWSVDGQNNWVSTGTDVGSGLTGTIVGATPGFNAPDTRDYTLASGSDCIDKAATLAGPPAAEYYRNETVKLQYRRRASVEDLGAFEHDTTGSGVGPYGEPLPPSDASLPINDAGADSGRDGGPTADAAPPATDQSTDLSPDGSMDPGDDSGCSCSLDGKASPRALLLLLAMLALVVLRKTGT